jgi:DNA modification methylase
LRQSAQVETRLAEYRAFLEAKRVAAPERGIAVPATALRDVLKPFQRDIVAWALRRGCAAIFASFGLGKTLMQLEIAAHIVDRCEGNFLIVTPLGVRQEFTRDAALLGVRTKFIRSIDECDSEHSIYLTNYETIRDGKLDPRKFTGVSLDEAAILRGFGGSKTFREFMRLFENGQVRYKFVATATPSPNEFIELLAYSAFLDVMDVGQAKTRFFKRDSTNADNLTLHPHKEREFWLWMSTWAIFLQKPSELGYSDEGYELPEMDIRWHEIPTDHADAGEEVSGQKRLVRNAAIGVTDASREKRRSLPGRLAKLMEIRAEDLEAHRVIWHDLEDERRAIESAIPACATVYGSQPLDEREEIVIDFSEGKIQELASKPVMLGSGCNFQRHCHWAVFLGIGFKFNDFIQAIHRCHRFLQTKKVRVDLIYTEAEREVRRTLERKWDEHKKLVAKMSEIIREYGLAANALHAEMSRGMGIDRHEESGDSWRMVNADCVEEAAALASDSAGLILTSIPFSTQYEYSPNYSDFGHSDDNGHFFRQMDFLTPELYRVLKPGRVAAIHVKDRIVPGGMTGLGFQTVYPFHADCIAHYTKHGFAYLGMKTIVTDVVRENNQTYRLGWTEQCKDGSRMGVGMPEYLLLFRKPPTDGANGYADEPVVKSKAEYSRSRWQIDAHGFARSSGDRLLAPEDLTALPHERISKLFRSFSTGEVYDYERHVALSESLETCPECHHIHIGSEVCGRNGNGTPKCECRGSGRLPVTFMLMQPQSWHPDVYTDITRMRTLNGAQQAKGREMHLCPMQFDLADRVIAQFSRPGETVFDPFAGIGTCPMRAVKLGRFGLGIELSERYFVDAVYYCREAERGRNVPALFDLEVEAEVSL